MMVDHELSHRTHSYSASTSLLRRVKQRDQQAWGRLVEIYAPYVYRWSRRFGLQPVDAEDAVGEVFATLINDVQRFDKDGRPQSFRRWLSTVCYHASLRIQSKRKPGSTPIGGSTAHLQMGELALPPEFERQLTAQDEVDWLRRRVLTVIEVEFPPGQWKAFWQTVIEQKTPSDVAESLGLSVWSVYKARASVLNRLRLELEDEQ